MKYAYTTTDGQAHDLRFVRDDYTPVSGENVVDGDVLPNIETLHEASYIAARTAAALKVAAQAALDRSDITILRCYENAVAVPETWQAYRTELRAIVSGTSSATSLPARPEYPEGT
ncbi:MAG: hypothetical protein A4E60_02349 [Syntrophorhabdus sp. PtaB.Bin047]|jgi:hypothetical protein|nr:MAG: hypothetical protein A4E60_02349 [Syntrophorhabdus sp. PtaB.Bin047]